MQSLLQSDKLQKAEGDLYKVLNVRGTEFPLYYGYYEEFERESPAAEPIPIYPDFLKEPVYTAEGFAFVTKMQDACKAYQGNTYDTNECGECMYFEPGEELIGICTYPKEVL